MKKVALLFIPVLIVFNGYMVKKIYEITHNPAYIKCKELGQERNPTCLKYMSLGMSGKSLSKQDIIDEYDIGD